MSDTCNISPELLEKMDAYWRAANYLSAGQLYLLDNPLLREHLTTDHIKKKDSRSLGYCSRTELYLRSPKQSYQEV